MMLFVRMKILVNSPVLRLSFVRESILQEKRAKHNFTAESVSDVLSGDRLGHKNINFPYLNEVQNESVKIIHIFR